MMGIYLIPGLQVNMDQIRSIPTVMVISNLEELKESGFNSLGDVEIKNTPAEKERTEYYRKGVDLARRHLLRQKSSKHTSTTDFIDDLRIEGSSYSKGGVVFTSASVCESHKESIALINSGFKDITITSVILSEDESSYVRPHPMIDTWEGSFFMFPQKSGSYHVLPPGGNITLSIGFIPSTPIKSTTQLIITSSLGQLRIPVEGYGVRSDYNVTAISMGRTPPGVAVGIEIEVYNPHDDWLVVKNIESSQHYIQLAISHSGDPAPSTQFQIPPRKFGVIGYAVANIPKTGAFRSRLRLELITVPSFNSDDSEEETEDEYQSSRKNTTDSSEETVIVTGKVSLYVPVFIQISATELFAVPNELDFGLLSTLSETRLRPVSVFNDGESPVTVNTVNFASNNSLLLLSYDSSVVIYPGQTAVVAEVVATGYVQGIINEALQVYFNDSSVLAIPIRVRTLYGRIIYPLSTTTFQNEDMGLHTIQHSRIPLYSTFNEPIRVDSVSVSSRYMAGLLLDANTVLKPYQQGCPVVITLRVFPPTPVYSAIVTLIVKTNLTSFFIPITVHNGGLVVTNTTGHHKESRVIDAGPLPPDNRKIVFYLANPTPWKISVFKSAVFYTVAGCEDDDVLHKINNYSMSGMGTDNPVSPNSVRKMTLTLPKDVDKHLPKVYMSGSGGVDREIKIIFDTKRSSVSTTSRQVSLTVRFSIIAGEILWRLKGRETEDWQRALQSQNKTAGGSSADYFSVNCGTMKIITAQMQHSFSSPLRVASVKSHSSSIVVQLPSQRLLPNTPYDLTIDIKVQLVAGTEFGRTMQLTPSDAEEHIQLQQFYDRLLGDEIGTYVTTSFIVEGLGSEITRTFWVQANATLHPFADDINLELPPSPPGTETSNWISVTNPLPFDVELELVEIPPDWSEIVAAAERKYISGKGRKRKQQEIHIGDTSQWGRSLKQATRRITLLPGESDRIGPVVFQQHSSSKNVSDSGHSANTIGIRTPTGYEFVTIHARLGYMKLSVVDGKSKKNPRKKSKVTLRLSDKQLNAILDLSYAPVSPLDFLRYILNAFGWPHPPPFNPPLPAIRSKYTLLLKNEGAIAVNVVGAGYKVGKFLSCSVGDLRLEGIYPCSHDSEINSVLQPGGNITFRVIFEPTLLVQQSNATLAICSTELGGQMTVPHAAKGVWLPGSDCISVELPVFGSLPEPLFPILMATAESADSFVRSYCTFLLLVIGVLLMVDTVMDSVDELLRKEQPIAYQISVESILQQISSTDGYISTQLTKQHHQREAELNISKVCLAVAF